MDSPTPKSEGNDMDKTDGSSTADLEEGCNLDGWILGKQIGSGGYAALYNATRNKVKGCLKVSEHLASSKVESEILKKLGKNRFFPNFLGSSFTEKCDDTNVYWIALSVEGPSLVDIVERLGKKPLAMDKSLMILHDITEALRVLHHMNFMHRDVKPGNILLSLTRGKAKIVLADLNVSTSIGQDGPVSAFKVPPGWLYASIAVAQGEPFTAIDDYHALIYVILHARKEPLSKSTDYKEQIKSKKKLEKDAKSALSKENKELWEITKWMLNIPRIQKTGAPFHVDAITVLKIIRSMDNFDPNVDMWSDLPQEP